MKFDIEKLKQVAEPMSDEERKEEENREANRDWLALSEKLALKIRYLLRTEKISQIELASRMGVSSAQVTKILSGKENLGLRTICKIEKALGQRLLDIDITEKLGEYSIQQKTYVRVVTVPVYIRSEYIEGGVQRANTYSPFIANNILV